MKAALLSIMGLGVGGAAYFGIHDKPDFDRVVNRPQMEVYAAFSALAPEGTVSIPDPGSGHRVTFKVTKVNGESIGYEIQLDDRPVVEAELSFAPAGDAGQTRMTAEVDLDEEALGSAFQMESGIALSLLSERMIDREFARLMGHMASEVESRRPLTPVGMDLASLRRARAEIGVAARRHDAATGPDAAARPMTRAEPMVDPNRAAAAYREGAANRAATRAAPTVDPNRAAAAYRNGSASPGGGWGR
ncbi:MAG TPA: hypothetical protein VMS43_00890 [Allosphingosinicella sp.]|nr:hypothetical protein [Allosphingosinicella sp.]